MRWSCSQGLTFWIVLFVVCVCGGFAPSSAAAEQTLVDAEWFERQIATGVVWRHYQFEDLYGAPQSVSVIEADLSHTSVSVRFPYLAASRDRTSSFVPQQFPNAVAAVNGSFFDTSAGGGGSTTFLRMNHIVITPQTGGATDMRTESAVTLSDGNYFRIQQRPTSGWDTYTRRRDILANGPTLIWRGIIPDFAPYGAHCSARHPRTAVGISSNRRLFLVTVDGRSVQAAGMSCDELARLMEELGCASAISMDGGGSTTMWVAGEANNGVVNFPSDNGDYDHLGERACSNAVAIMAPPAPPARWDARLLDIEYDRMMESGTTQAVTLHYENLGTETWTQSSTSLVVTRPRTRFSSFYSDTWVTTTTPALLNQPGVAPGQTGSFSFVLTAPMVASGQIFSETFGLVQEYIGPFGPADNEVRLKVAVEPPGSASSGTVIIESRSGGQNFTRYSEAGGWADSPVNCTAPGLTGTIGSRYGSTFRSVAGAKAATFRPNFAEGGPHNVYIAYGNGGGLARSPITYTVTDASSTTTTYLIDQTGNHNTWILLGTHTFAPGDGGSVTVSNADIDVSGNMYAGAAKFDPVVPTSAQDWQLY